MMVGVALAAHLLRISMTPLRRSLSTTRGVPRRSPFALMLMFLFPLFLPCLLMMAKVTFFVAGNDTGADFLIFLPTRLRFDEVPGLSKRVCASVPAKFAEFFG